MSDPEVPPSPSPDESIESFKEIFTQYEKSHARKPEEGSAARDATVIAVSAESVFLDIGFKTEGIMPLAAFQGDREPPKPGDKLLVTVKGRDPEGYYEVVRGKISRPTDWASLEKSFSEKATIIGTVTGVVKGGLTVDVGVRAFMPASRSGTRDASEMEKLVGQEIRCRITKLDVTEEDVVVDRRIVAEDEENAAKERRYSEVKEGETVRGTVRSLTDYGAFVDIGGVDALLHVGEISWRRIDKPADALSVGQEIEVKILKIDPEKRRVSVGMKQLQPNPWDSAAEKYKTGERVRGVVTRVADFGAFVELEPGLEGLIHVSEMSWAKKVRHPGDLVKPGETVETVILGVNSTDRRISLGLKQTLGDPWIEAAQRLTPGSVVEGPVTSITKFGAFVQVAEGVEGMIHVSEISAEKRINHPQDVLKVGQLVRAQILAVDSEKRQLRLSMKQLVPTGLDEYLAEHKEGDVVTGRMIEVPREVSKNEARVELGEGIQALCRVAAPPAATSLAGQDKPDAPLASAAKPDLSSLSSMLQSRWKSGAPEGGTKQDAVRPGQIRQFRITKLDAEAKKIEVELA
jgi:small subunit ribosomal protein S1